MKLPQKLIWRLRMRLFPFVLRVAGAFVTLSELVCPFDLDNPGKVNLHKLTLPELMVRTWRLKLTGVSVLLSRHLADVGAAVCPFNLRERI